MQIDELTTPAVLVDEKRLLANIQQMQAKADAQNVNLRPHVKTHKSVALARRQTEQGAQGITVATVDEAEIFVRAGFSDVRLAYSLVGKEKHKRLLALREQATVSFCVDTVEGARQASAVYEAAGQVAPVLLEVDTGHHRCGVLWNSPQLVELGQEVNRLPGLQLVGVLTHAGQAYEGPKKGETKEEALNRAAREERSRILEAAKRLQDGEVVAGAAVETFEISIGSTPTMSRFSNTTQNGFSVTEIRPGNYIFNDAMQVGLGVTDLSNCALTVLTRVVSKHREGTRDRIIVDAGTKVFSSDTGVDTSGHGVILYNAASMRVHPHAAMPRLSEEHGWVYVPGAATFHVGDTMRIVPNHACTTVGLQRQLHLVRDDTVVDTVAVDARDRAQGNPAG